MTTTTQLTKDQLLMYSEKAPEKASVLLRHEDGRILPAVEYKRGSGFWYPDGKVSALNGIFDDVELVAVRHEGFFMNMSDYQNRNTGTGGKRADRMLEQQTKLLKARQPRKDSIPVKTGEVDLIEPTLFQSDIEKVRNTQAEQFAALVEANPAPAQTLNDMVDVMDADDDFTSIADLQSDLHQRRGELYLSLRSSGQIVYPKLLSDLIGLSPFDIQISQKKRMLRLTIGSGPLVLPKSGKMSCAELIRIIHKIKGMEGDPMKSTIGRVVLTQLVLDEQIFAGSF